MKRPLTLFTLSLLVLASGWANAADAPASKPPRVILVGDSTMATKSGYGDALCRRFRPDVSCINLARGGRSTGSFRAEGRWDEVQALLRDDAPYSATYVLIQFGHNDQPGKPGRSTDLVTQFPDNLARYVTEVTALGGVPVLLTPLTRRTFKGQYLHNDLAPWAEAARRVARAHKVALLDLNVLSGDAVQAMGQDQADTLAQAPKPVVAASVAGGAAMEPQGAPKSAFDRTHVGAKGSALFSGMVATELKRLFPALAPAFEDSASLAKRP
jgi:lysophospholipase L1-like esterase